MQSPGPCFLDQSACFPFRSPHSGPTTLRPPAPFVPCHILSPTAAMCVCVLECMCVCVRVCISLSRARSLSLSLCDMCLSIRKTVRRECARTASELAGERARDSASKRETSLNRRKRTGWKTTVYTMAHAHSNRARPRSKGCFRHLILSVGIASVIELVCEQNMHAVHVHAVRRAHI